MSPGKEKKNLFDESLEIEENISNITKTHRTVSNSNSNQSHTNELSDGLSSEDEEDFGFQIPLRGRPRPRPVSFPCKLSYGYRP